MSDKEEIKSQALISIKSAITYPDKARLAAGAIVSDICGRAGIKHEWNQIDPNIQGEIVETWVEIISTIFDENFNVRDITECIKCKEYSK